MVNISDYEDLFDKHVIIRCTDGDKLSGILSDWVSALDNEPDPESIMIDTADGDVVEIFVQDIESIVEG